MSLTWAQLGVALANMAPASAQLGPTWLQLEPNLGPTWRNLDPSWTRLEALRPKLSSTHSQHGGQGRPSTKSWKCLVHFCFPRFLALMKLRVEQCFPCSLYIGSNLVRTCCRIGPKLHHVGPDLGWAYMLGAHLGRLGPTPTWAQLGLQLTLHGIELRHVRPTCAGTPRVGPSWSQMVQVGPKLGPS
jgi:hypothetical protein